MISDRALRIAVGRRIREQRSRHGWSQEELADRAQVHLSFIGQIERGVKAPSLPTLQRLAHALGVRAGDLMDDSPAAASKPEYPLARQVANLIREQPADRQRLLLSTLRHLARQARRIARPGHPKQP